MIGDGDNNAGLIPPKLAATLAKKYNITIYTIGVGTSGAVVYGRDSSGNPRTYEKTFSDNDFRTIATITNGKYYWTKDEQDVNRILRLIFR